MRLQFAGQSQRTVVQHLHNAQNRHAHKQADQTAAVGKKISRSVQLGPMRCNELFLFEEDGQTRYMFAAEISET